MSVLAPDEVVRRIFDARRDGDVRRALALVDPGVWTAIDPGGRARVEVDAHRIEHDGAEGVRVYGRVRVIDGGSIADSPAAWLFTVRHGRVVAIAPLALDERALRRVA